MSLISLASVRALQEDAVAEGRKRPGRIPDAADAQQRIIGQLVAFIPAEPVALFVAVLAAVGVESDAWLRWTLFGVVVALAPLWVEIHYLQRARSRRARKKVPVFEMIAGVIAFVAWSTSVPGSPWNDVGNFSPRWGLLVALLTAGALLTVSELREALLRGRTQVRRDRLKPVPR
jgi:cation transport ATPase